MAENDEQAELRHRAGQRAEKNADGGRRKQVAGGHRQPVGPYLGHHDLEWRQRHDQQVFDGAVFALADESCADQDDGQHGDAVDDLHDATDPDNDQVGVEAHAGGQPDRRFGHVAGAGQVLIYLAERDGLDVGGADESLAHDRRVNIELDVRFAAGFDVVLEIGRDDQREVEAAGIENSRLLRSTQITGQK